MLVLMKKNKTISRDKLGTVFPFKSGTKTSTNETSNVGFGQVLTDFAQWLFTL